MNTTFGLTKLFLHNLSYHLFHNNNKFNINEGGTTSTSPGCSPQSTPMILSVSKVFFKDILRSAFPTANHSVLKIKNESVFIERM